MAVQRPLRTSLLVVALLIAGCTGTIAPVETPTQTTQPSSSITTTANGTVEVHFINVGQSVSTLIVGPTNETMLIDTGHYNDDGAYILQYLQNHDITRLDHLVVSHNDADHIGGNAAIIDYYETEADGVGAIYDPGIAASTQTYEEYLDAVEEHDVTLYETRGGDTIDFEGVDIDVLGPPDPYIENEARNENSIVLMVTFGETSFLLSGDAEDDQEEYLVDEYGDELQATVFKAGHHGSSSSSSEQFLDAIQPEAVVISSAYDSQYDHPTDEVLGRLADRSLPAYWTATHGDIVFVSNGTSVSVQTQQDAPTDPSELRSADSVEPGTVSEVIERVLLTGGTIIQSEPVATDGGTTEGELALQTINADAEGNDRENLNDEYLVFENTGESALDISGWTISDAAGATYTVPDDTTLGAGESLTLYTGSGTDTEAALYWGSGSPIWNNAGDTVTVQNSEGNTVLQETYE